jgi:hypothetical protein
MTGTAWGVRGYARAFEKHEALVFLFTPAGEDNRGTAFLSVNFVRSACVWPKRINSDLTTRINTWPA